MGVAGNLALHGAQPEAFGGVVAGGLDPAVVEDDGLGPAAFEEQLAIFGARKRLAQHRKGRRLVEMRLEGPEGGVGHGLSLIWVTRRRYAAIVLLVGNRLIWFQRGAKQWDSGAYRDGVRTAVAKAATGTGYDHAI